MKFISTLFLFIFSFQLFAQQTFPTNGPADERERYYAFTNANIVVSPGNEVKNATLVIKDKKVVSVGKQSAPKGAVVIDLAGKTIYPSFIELNSNYGLSNVKQPVEPGSRGPQELSYKKGAFGWNQAIHPEMEAHSYFASNKKEAEDLRKNGFGVALTHIQDGIARGTGSLVTLGEERENEELIAPTVSSHFSFNKGTSSQDYPSSLMGSIALLRQSHYDAEWYKNNSSETNLSLKAWIEQNSLPAFFDVSDVLNVFRANKLGKEIGKPFIVIGNGDEYQKIKELNQLNTSLVIPVSFPKAYDVDNPFQANVVSLKELKHWEYAPYNLAFLAQKNIPFAITSSKLEKDENFIANIRKAVKNGLSEQQALAALTTKPAELINQSGKVGSLQTGKLANFIITDGNLFTDEKSNILENWVQGKQFILKKEDKQQLNTNYNLKLQNKTYQLEVSKEKPYKLTVVENDTTKLKTKGSYANGLLNFNFSTDNGLVRLNGWESGNNLKGKAILPNGDEVNWVATPTKASHESEKEEAKKEEEEKEHAEYKPSIDDIPYPFLGYGWTTQPEQNAVLFKNATVWTNEKDGILEDTDVLIKNGKIQQIGQSLSARGAKVINAKGKHLTAGIIDEHSHISISSGVNEGTQASSAEVRIGDVVNSEHIALYRVLAGGVTTSQLLHGSANPIGGQSAIIKSRWGLMPEQMKFEGADGFIKFALGENVKQSNWGSQYSSRFPQTRMGVEQVYENYFTLAKEYAKNRKTNPNATRRNIELETLAEIINKERFISCHSYVQSEINMLMHVAEQFGFNVNTFTHILEGYKVADKMKEHGVGGSTFSDWWAYKYEVIDAIPYNAAIMAKEGVITAINSDDAEMARRLNQEAAKTMKYGGLSAEEAWKTVTLNPAKLLHIDDRVGSIKKGKDADIVLWSDSPLSVYAKVEQTYVDGRKYFDLSEDEQKQQDMKKERARIIQKMVNAGKDGVPKQKPKGEEGSYYSCKHLGMIGLTNAKHNHE